MWRTVLATCLATLAVGDDGPFIYQCPPGQKRVGNACEAILCPANYHVVSHGCVACPDFTENEAGDDATGADTECVRQACVTNWYPPACADYDLRLAVAAWVKDACAAVGRYGHIKDWDVSCVSDMSGLFEDAAAFNADLSAWQVSQVTDFSDMFAGATSFDQDLGWCVADTVDAHGAFAGAACESASCGVQQSKECAGAKPCPDGTTGADCAPILCAENEHVRDHACVACPADTASAAGADASGADTACKAITFCRDDVDWHRKDQPDHTCAHVEEKNAKKKWRKKRAKKNCKAKSADGVRAREACACSACDPSRFKSKKKSAQATVVIIVPICVGAVFLAAVGYAASRKRENARMQRRLSHRDTSMPTVGTKKFVAAREAEAGEAGGVDV